MLCSVSVQTVAHGQIDAALEMAAKLALARGRSTSACRYDLVLASNWIALQSVSHAGKEDRLSFGKGQNKEMDCFGHGPSPSGGDCLVL